MINRIKELKLDFSKNRNSEWYKEIQSTRARFDAQIAEENKKTLTNSPIHPARLCDDLIKVAWTKMSTTIIGTASPCPGWMSRAFTCRFMGQVVDAGPLAPVGHGVGMGIGAQLARPGQHGKSW